MYGGSTLFDSQHSKGPFIELFLKHRFGQCAGYDKKSGRILSSLPGSCYVEQAIGSGSKSRSLVVPDPPDGKYTLSVTANESGVYLVEVDVMVNDDYVSKSISGLASSGDVQEIEISYSNSVAAQLLISKKVDLALLKREIEMALRKGRLDRQTGKDLVRDLMHLDRALACNVQADARNHLGLFISRLQKRQEKFRIKSQRDIKNWFTDYFTANPHDLLEIEGKKDVFFLNIDNIREQKKEDWFEARSVAILLEDANTMLAGLSRP